jgi:uncharacterized damage-inducible protein DinB
MTTPEVWLRGPVPGVPASLQPVAHALLQSIEDVERAVEPLSSEQVWARPGGAAAVGFHLFHLAGSTDRLFTYARGESLSADQRARLDAERQPDPVEAAELLAAWREQVEAALAQLRSTAPSTVGEHREVGRAKLPSSVGGLLFHAAEHAQRHTGQVVTTARILVGLASGPAREPAT